MQDPITGICIVADPYRCPPNYELIYKSYDKKEDCDLWKDGMFRTKVTRYICISRLYDPLTEGLSSSVLTDITIQNERDIPPAGYTLIEKALDTGERAVKKKQICVKMVPRSSVDLAVSDLIILSKSKNVPFGFVYVGDINGLTLCVKMGSVPSVEMHTDTSSVPASGSSAVCSVYAPYTARLESPFHAVSNGMSAASSYSDFASTNGTDLQNPFADIPFSLHPKCCRSGFSRVLTTIPCKSLDEIESEFSYSFNLEYSVAEQLPSGAN